MPNEGTLSRLPTDTEGKKYIRLNENDVGQLRSKKILNHENISEV